ncbi:MAG: hypothetical protein RJA36_2088 [Pseudomonadota bacterium]|jgi:glutathione S-transferase
MKLIGTLTSPFVRKARIVMAEKKLDFEFVVDPFGTEQSRIAEFNPLGKVPCLVTENGESVYDSSVIVEYLDALSPVGRLIPAAGRERAVVKTWEALADGLMDAAVLIRMETHWSGRTEQQRSQAWVDYQMGKIERALKAMSRALGDRPYFHGRSLSLADIAVGCALDYLDLRQPQLDWRSDYPALQQLHDRLSLRPSFADTRPPTA